MGTIPCARFITMSASARIPPEDSGIFDASDACCRTTSDDGLLRPRPYQHSRARFPGKRALGRTCPEEQRAAVDVELLNLVGAGPRLVPRRLYVVDDATPVDRVSAGIRDQATI